MWGRFLLEPRHALRDRDDSALAPDMLHPLEAQAPDTTPLDGDHPLALALVHQPRPAFLAKVAIELPPLQGLPAVAGEMRRVCFMEEERNVDERIGKLRPREIEGWGHVPMVKVGKMAEMPKAEEDCFRHSRQWQM